MKSIVWIVDEILLEKHDDVGFPDLASAAEAEGHRVIRTKYVPFSTQVSNNLRYELEKIQRNDVVVAYGCTGFMRQLYNDFLFKGFCPGGYYKINELKYSNYSWRFPNLMLNDDYILLPYGEIESRMGSGHLSYEIFIRPNVVTKSFAGRVIDFASISETPEALAQYDPIDNDELCVIARPKEILGEYRHIICNREVIAESQYRWESKLDIRIDVHWACHNLAQYVAEHSFQPDYVYVVDTCLVYNDFARIVEFNTFSCAGLYACDTVNIVKKVSEMAWKEFEGDL